MMNIKKQFIKSRIKLEVVSNAPGKLEIYVAQIKKVEQEYKVYEGYAENALLLLKGVKSLQIDYPKGIAAIHYDPKITGPHKVFKWLQVMIDIGIDYYDELKPIWEKQPEVEEAIRVKQIWEKMKPVLEEALSKTIY